MILFYLKTKPLKFRKWNNTILSSLRLSKKFQSSYKDNDKTKSKIQLPKEPQNCCMSGCANCVWVAYAEELAKILNDNGETAKQKIIENIKDPNLRAFVMLELSHLFKNKKK